MKRLTLRGTALLAIFFLLAGCDTLRTVRGTGDIGAEEREVSDYSAVDLAGIGTVIVESGAKEALRIEAEENILPYLESEVEGGVLILDMREGVNVVPTQGIFYYLTVRELDEITVSGLGNVDVPRLESSDPRIEISGGGSISVDELRADSLDVLISGLGELAVGGGEVGMQQIEISGGGTYKARELASETAKVSIDGLGSAEVRAQEKLDAAINGGGMVRYAGRPQVTQAINGLGEVKPLGDE